MPKKVTTEDFIQKASKIHNNKFDYSKLDYKNSRDKIIIICYFHGDFLQEPSSHLRGRGCPKCKSEKVSERNRITQYEFIKRAIVVHNGEYTYDNVKYKNSVTKVSITCPIHGNFLQQPSLHLQGNKCPECHTHAKITTKNFISRANIIHKNKYEYSISICYGGKYNIDIICPLHGKFEQQASEHLRGRGCPQCSYDDKRLSLNEFITKSNKIHDSKYDYTEVVYKRNNKKVKIICLKHGRFYQTPTNHLSGAGCPLCNSSKGEEKTSKFLTLNNIDYIPQKTFNNLVGSGGWKLRFDFYLPKYNICIEYDGIQHFKPTYFGSRKNKSKVIIEKISNNKLKKTQEHDKRKNEYCRKHNIKLLRIRYDEDINIVLSNYFKL